MMSNLPFSHWSPAPENSSENVYSLEFRATVCVVKNKSSDCDLTFMRKQKRHLVASVISLCPNTIKISEPMKTLGNFDISPMIQPPAVTKATPWLSRRCTESLRRDAAFREDVKPN